MKTKYEHEVQMMQSTFKRLQEDVLGSIRNTQHAVLREMESSLDADKLHDPEFLSFEMEDDGYLCLAFTPDKEFVYHIDCTYPDDAYYTYLFFNNPVDDGSLACDSFRTLEEAKQWVQAHYNLNKTLLMVKRNQNLAENIADKFKFIVTDLGTGKAGEWSLQDILYEINRDRSAEWTDYDETDFKEGWEAWVEGDIYSLQIIERS